MTHEYWQNSDIDDMADSMLEKGERMAGNAESLKEASRVVRRAESRLNEAGVDLCNIRVKDPEYSANGNAVVEVIVPISEEGVEGLSMIKSRYHEASIAHVDKHGNKIRLEHEV
jgi:hypothetical protein